MKNSHCDEMVIAFTINY